MPPDLNSLPSSPPPLASATPPLPPQAQTTNPRPRRISFNNADAFRANGGPPSPRSPPLSSLQAAATINRGLHRSPSSNSPNRNMQGGLERRRSSLMNNLSINDPTVPAPGELQPSNSANGSPRTGRRSIALATADPHHHRQPSLGELHQELENEQEAQVNRLLHMIRMQQDQLAHLQRQHTPQQDPSPTSTEHTHFPTPPSSLPTQASTDATTQHSSPRTSSVSGLQAAHGHFNRPHSLSWQSSTRLSTAGTTSSRGGSPVVRPASGNLGPLTEDFLLGGTRDECAFYQAETQTLTRENQMLKLRLRELERQISDLNTSATQAAGSATAGLAHSPAHNSPLATPALLATTAKTD